MSLTSSVAHYTSNLEIACRPGPHNFTLDGDVRKEAWKHAEWVTFDHDLSGQPSFPEAETRVAALWTPANLYLAFQCRYSTLNVFEGGNPGRERWGLWDRDVVEAFVNPQPERLNHYYEFEVAPNDRWIDLEIDKSQTPFNDAGWDSHFEHATRVDEGARLWTAELRIPAASMGVSEIHPGAAWRINFFRADGPGDDTKRRFLAWSAIPEGRSFHVPTAFGLIRFEQ